MQSKNIIIGLGVLVLIGAAAFLYKGGGDTEVAPTNSEGAPTSIGMPVPGSNVEEMVVGGTQPVDAVEYTMTAYYDEKGKWFSQKEMSAKKGETVRVIITNTKGMHDFSLDEYGIKQELPLNQPVVIEFVADKAGEFVYYCSMPGHKAGGQWGTLRVTE